jgi:hypothetical protein
MTASRVASVLAVLAALAVLGTTVAAVAAYMRLDGGATTSEAATPVRAFRGGQLVGDRRGDAVFEVPARSRGWAAEGGDTLVYYVDRSGAPAVGLTGPAVFRDGYCAGRPGGSNRGFVGFDRSTTGTHLRAANVATARAWVRAVALGEDLRTSAPHTRLRTDVVTLADGSTAIRSSSRITTVDRGRCGAPAVVVATVSLRTGDRVAHLVMVRDAGEPGTLSSRRADRILGTLRRVRGEPGQSLRTRT